MKKSILFAAALLALGGCVSHNFSEGERTNYRCDGGKEFSLREVAGSIEVYAAGETHRLMPAGDDVYSGDGLTYTKSGRRASLTGVSTGAFENCRGRALNSWMPTLW
jgi:hypothetical protein